jgi:hypothetical protein
VVDVLGFDGSLVGGLEELEGESDVKSAGLEVVLATPLSVEKYVLFNGEEGDCPATLDCNREIEANRLTAGTSEGLRRRHWEHN